MNLIPKRGNFEKKKRKKDHNNQPSLLVEFYCMSLLLWIA